eukprot:CAMPEP_0114329572 /NCGR_PEP_ID=MMETSP0101-20121206/1163_1 /TAXON_ID=38822 ORGANISM="Pteridomonas danica, Strain PT" /NCGR_SAMPLE_ID=MMETSP0101 /ASSEMBLY_ACC=CAM_ASM_000211 /LENGTH=86 /DNA_ID=CAMNT_0001459273 /DNA_START=184 /DNA_END=444 /DNA_ORIENTATION=-
MADQVHQVWKKYELKKHMGKSKQRNNRQCNYNNAQTQNDANDFLRDKESKSFLVVLIGIVNPLAQQLCLCKQRVAESAGRLPPVLE